MSGHVNTSQGLQKHLRPQRVKHGKSQIFMICPL